MADLATGANAESGDWLNFEGYNRLKNHWRMADPRTNLTGVVAGMIVSDSDTERLYHRKAAAWEQIVQRNVPIYDDDGDSYISFGFYADDIGLLTVPANPLRENILTNSEIKVWSNSDANEGLGSMGYDSGSIAPVVGETMTGATSGAVGKIISYTLTGGTWGGGNAAGVITLGACDGRFNDNEDVNGSVGGANMLTVNMPDTAAGVDLVRNGEFQAGVGGWTPSDCTLASIAGGQIGNCLQMTRTGGSVQDAYQAISLTAGKIYKITLHVKSGTSGNENFSIQMLNGGLLINRRYDSITTAAWVLHTLVFEANTNDLYVNLEKVTATAGTMLFDEVSCYEITPCCTAADALAFDGWFKDNLIDIYREHSNEEATTKRGSFYSLKMVPTTLGYWVQYPTTHDKEELYKQYRGRTVTAGCWALTSAASHFRLAIYDGVMHYSSYHTGGGTWEWIEVTYTVGIAVTNFRVILVPALAGNVNGSTIVYVSQPMLVFGASIGAGNYRPRQQEIVWLEKYIGSNKLTALSGQSDLAWTALNIEADTDGKLPKGCKSIFGVAAGNDSGSAGTDCYFLLRGTDIAGSTFGIRPYGKANDALERNFGWQSCSEYGDVDYTIEATGVGTFDIDFFNYKAVQVN